MYWENIVAAFVVFLMMKYSSCLPAMELEIKKISDELLRVMVRPWRSTFVMLKRQIMPAAP